MWSSLVVTIIVFVVQTQQCAAPAEEIPIQKFPANFSFGVASSAYQIEGGWNADGKGPSLWDDFTHNHPDKIADHSNGDVAADSYHFFDKDLEALKELKVNHYRFSIAWTRIYPTGDISSKNKKGIDYYNNIIDKLLANNIEPMVTMFHNDLPSEIQKFGGLANHLFINQFFTYAMELFENYGDRVKTWITFNEALTFCQPGYGNGNSPPQIHGPGIIDYLCIDNIIKAHAAAYRGYRSKFYEQQRGKVGIVISANFFFSKSNNSDIVDRGMQYNLGFIAHPIFSKIGGYPEVMVREITSNSLKEKRDRSRLPSMEGRWKAIVKGSADFLGLNYYTSSFITRAVKSKLESPSWDSDLDCDTFADPDWIRGKSSWLYSVPDGLEGVLKYIRDEYDNVEVIVTENGWSDDGDMVDDSRISYVKGHLQAVLNAVRGGCNVSGYTYWSLLDNFEWGMGYTEKFGLYAVNMASSTKERTAKKSARYYRRAIETRSVPNGVD